MASNSWVWLASAIASWGFMTPRLEVPSASCLGNITWRGQSLSSPTFSHGESDQPERPHAGRGWKMSFLSKWREKWLIKYQGHRLGYAAVQTCWLTTPWALHSKHGHRSIYFCVGVKGREAGMALVQKQRHCLCPTHHLTLLSSSYHHCSLLSLLCHRVCMATGP